jgi:hypothetical protein
MSMPGEAAPFETQKPLIESPKRSSGGAAMSVNEKRLKERWNVMKELVDTEHSYHQDMTVGVDIFMTTALSVSCLTPEDRRIIFGNIDKIRDLASQFLEGLKRSVASVYQIPSENRFHFNLKRQSTETSKTGGSGNNTQGPPPPERHEELDQTTTVGQAFLEFTERMDVLYGVWMKNHDSSNKRIQQVKDIPQVKIWLEECRDNAKDITNAWDLDSLLVKPTQRYMKYPLLLRAIIKSTPDDHPDRMTLEEAVVSLEKSIVKINDDKRNNEVVEKALQKHHDKSSKEKRTLEIRKMLIFRGRGASQSKVPTLQVPDGADNSTEAIIQRFGGHFFQIQVVMRDFDAYLDSTQKHIDRHARYIDILAENYRSDRFTRFPELESRVHQYAEAIASIKRHALPEHVSIKSSD